MSDLVFEDFNGDTFLTGSAGEREERLNNRLVAVPTGIPFYRGEVFDTTDQLHQDYLDLFFRLNYWFMVQQHVAAPAPVAGVQAVRAPDPVLAARLRRIAYVRTMSARMGHYHYEGTPAGHHARYSEFERMTFPRLQAFARDVFADNTIAITDLATARAGIEQVPHAADDVAWHNAYRSKHLNVVCMIAYFFRVRGHHWIQEMDDRYKAVWRKCLYDEDTPGVDWQYLAHDALHAIFPDDLDDIWVDAADDDACAGALIKRLNSAPAGIAIVPALNAGVSDLRLLVPKAFDFVPDAMTHLRDLNNRIATHRFAGSVNRRLYDAPDIVPDETALAALASIIRAGLDSWAASSPLLKSAALKRVANNAPMTGGMIGKMVNTAVRSDSAAEIFLPEMRPAVGPAGNP